MALLATIRHGPLLPTDDHGHDARSKLFCDASTYALTEEEAREVIGSSDAAFRLYLKGLLLAGTFNYSFTKPTQGDDQAVCPHHKGAGPLLAH